MSFATRAKNEMCKSADMRECCVAAETYGALLFSNKFSAREIRAVSENEGAIARLRDLLRRMTGITVDIAVSGGKHIINILGDAAVEIFTRFGGDAGRHVALHLNAAMVEEEHCRQAFIRGAFLAAGSVSDPGKNYHLELVTRHYNLSREVVALLLDMEFSPKTAIRKSTYVIYFKDSEAVEDFLTHCGAPSAALAIMEAKVEKDVRNSVNRKVNCDMANTLKTVAAAARQIDAIERLQAAGVLDTLSEPLKQAAYIRLENPEETLSELADMAGTSRSGLNHRLNRLVTLSQRGGAK